MAKKPVALDGLLNTESRPTDTGIPQRGAGQATAQDKRPPKREGEKRLTLALDGDTYRRLKALDARRRNRPDRPQAPNEKRLNGDTYRRLTINCPCGIP